MNKRLQELEAQCWITVPCDFDIDKGGACTTRTIFDRKKFARLILEECIKIDEESDYILCAGENYTVGSKIAQRFGLDENGELV